MTYIYENALKTVLKSVEFYLFLLTLIFLLVLSRVNFLVFHFAAEGYSILISCTVFIISWNIRKLNTNPILLIISIGMLFVGLIDALHTLSYFGLGLFKFQSPKNVPTQFWVMARYLQALFFLLSPILIIEKLGVKTALAAFGGIAAIGVSLIFAGYFPECFSETSGLTTFNILSEYFVALCFTLAAFIFYRTQSKNYLGSKSYLLVSLLFMILAELVFTFYADVFDFSNALGHIFKIIAFYFIYKGVIQSNLVAPLDFIFKEVRESEGLLKYQNESLVNANASILNNLNYYKFALDQTAMVTITDTHGVIESANDEFVRVTGYSQLQTLGQTHRILSSGQHGLSFYKDLWKTLLSGKSWVGKLKNKAHDGTLFWVNAHIVPFKDNQGRIEKFVSIQYKITDQE